MRQLFILLVLFFTSISTAHNLVPGKLLFDNPTYQQVNISPNGEYISYVELVNSRKVVTLFNTGNEKKMLLSTLGRGEGLMALNWLNPELIYIKVGTAKQNAEYLVKFRFQDNLPKENFHRLSGGFMVDTLEEDTNHVIFAIQKTKRTHKIRLAKIHVDDLLASDFEKSSILDIDNKRLLSYTYDHKFQRLIKTTFDEDNKTASLMWRKLGKRRWRQIIEFDIEDDSTVIPLKFLNENTLAVLSNKDSDKIALYEYSIDNQAVGKLLYKHSKYDLTDANFTDDGDLKSVAFYQKGRVTYHYVDNELRKNSKRYAKVFKDKMVFNIGQSQDIAKSLLYVESSSFPGAYYLHNHITDKIELLFHAFPELTEYSFLKTDTYHTVTKDGVELEAYLTKPKDFDTNTLLVMPHGGPINVQETDFFNPVIQFFANRGFSILRVNFRGSSGFGKKFMNQGVGQLGQLIEDDISHVVNEHLANNSYRHVCAVGSSYGAYSSTMLAIRAPETYQCIAAGYGIYDLPLLFNSSNYKVTDFYRELVAKTVGQQSETHKEFSPIHLTNKLNSKLLLIAGERDKISGIEQTNRFKYVLNNSNKPVESMYYKKVGHGHQNWYGEYHEATAIVDFLDRTFSLDLIRLGQFNEKNKSNLINDYMLLADTFDDPSYIEAPTHKAAHYYKIAADLGDSRAQFNVAASIHRGDLEGDSKKIAIDLYLKSANQGSEFAHRRLGNLYMKGELVEKSHIKAAEHFQKAFTLKESNTNRLNLAFINCMGIGVEKDVNKCIEYFEFSDNSLDTKQQKDSLVKTRKQLLARAFAEGNYQPSEVKDLQNFIIDKVKVNFVEVELDIEEQGYFIFEKASRYGKSGNLVIITEENSVTRPEKQKLWFGIKFGTDKAGLDKHKDRTAVIVNWTKKDANGNEETESSSILWGSPVDEWSALYSSTPDDTFNQYQLKVFNLKRELLFSETYTIN